MINYNDPLFIQWNTDEAGNKISVEILNEEHKIVDNKVTLTQIPDNFYRVQINGFTEINIKEEIDSATKFKVNYLNGIITFDSSLDGQTITITKYYGRGIIYYPASRIYSETNGNNVVETLQDIINTNKIIYQNPVATYNDISTTYPSPVIGWTVQELEFNKFYRWDGTEWRFIQQFDIANIQTQINENSNKIGDLSNLNTSDTSSLVSAINEVKADTSTVSSRVTQAETTPEIYNTSSIFSTGVGTDGSGNPLDYSASVQEGQINVTKIRAISSVEPFYIKLLKNEQEVLSKYINVQLNPGEIYDCDIKIPNFIGADKIVIDSNDEIEITYTMPLNLGSNIDGLNDEIHSFVNHKTDNMPHEFQDNDTGKTYKYGFKQENGFVVFMYEEVI